MTTPTKLYAGPPVVCTWCAYAPLGAVAPAPATHVIETDKGPREVCERHAFRGRWEQRTRRVSAVA